MPTLERAGGTRKTAVATERSRILLWAGASLEPAALFQLETSHLA